MTDKKPARVIDHPQGPRGIQVKTEYGHPTTTIIARIYRLIVGFEVNHPTAFIVKENGQFFKKRELTQILDQARGGDYGHAFFYLTRSNIVLRFFSFGPQPGLGKEGWLGKGDSNDPTNKWNTGALVKNGYADSRPGTPSYRVGEVAKLFRLRVTEKSALAIVKKIDEVIGDIKSGNQKYTAWVNDTCGETARDILAPYISNLPDGTGAVDADALAPVIHAVNPYMWHHNFKKAGFEEITYPVKALEDKAKAANKPYLEIGGESGFEVTYIEPQKARSKSGWALDSDIPDPLIEKGYVQKPY